ncbi:DUF3800 domain-containing protein [Vibrio owensii]|nr:DUF3800 domain-containing protein [Vibrio owensii]
MTQKIYFDESGFTGNNLLSARQEFFSYGSVASSDEEAKEVVEHIIKKYKIQNGELKGGRLLGNNRGKKAISELLEIYDGRMKSVVQNKKFALAGKFFEYIFEPALAQKNVLFYELNFHKFVANYLYIEFIVKEKVAEELFLDFENFMRNKATSDDFFTINTPQEATMPFQSILDFAQANRQSVIDELNSLEGTGLDKWILDLTDTSLFNLLAYWGQHHQQLTAVCDDAKPLKEDMSIFDAMINRTDKRFQSIGGKTVPMTFNLSEPVNLVDSKIYHGVQIADVVSAVSVYVANEKKNDPFYDKWVGTFFDQVIYGYASVVPEVEYVELERDSVKLNALLLEELASRSRDKLPLMEGIEEYIQMVNYALKFAPKF